jgi:hypothetical protein
MALDDFRMAAGSLEHPTNARPKAPNPGINRRIVHSLNGRPRQTLDWTSPSEKLAEVLQ